MPGKAIELFQWETKSLDPAKRQIEAIASTGAMDRDGEIITPEALRKALPGFMKNPVVLAGHQHRLSDGRSPVVGHVVKAEVKGNALHVVIEFAKTDLGEEYWQLYQGKHQRAFSIGFKILSPPRTEMREGKRVAVIDEIELYEISCVAVGANPEALSKSAQKKLEFVQKKREERQKKRAERISYQIDSFEEYLSLLGFSPKQIAELNEEENAVWREMFEETNLQLKEKGCKTWGEWMRMGDEEYEAAVAALEKGEGDEGEWYDLYADPKKEPSCLQAGQQKEVQTIQGLINEKTKGLVDLFGSRELYQKYQRWLKYPSSTESDLTSEELEVFRLIERHGVEGARKRISGLREFSFAELMKS